MHCKLKILEHDKGNRTNRVVPIQLSSWRCVSNSLAVLLFCLASVNPAFASDEARRLVSILDYLGSDYKNAVSDGKVLNQDEYSEMQEFSNRTQELFKQLKEL